jgi:hypothetical protein
MTLPRMCNSQLRFEFWCEWHEYSVQLPAIRNVIRKGSEWATDIIKALRSVTNSASGEQRFSHTFRGTLT